MINSIQYIHVLLRITIIALAVVGMATTTKAEDEREVTDVDCRSIHEVLIDVGAEEFSVLLKDKKFNFKYGEFTIFAPTDRTVKFGSNSLTNDGYNQTIIDDVLFFHIAANTIEDDIRDPSNCGKSLIMLNEDSFDQESSTTECKKYGVLQVGPGNTATGRGFVPKIVGNATQACNGVVYTIEDALMLPTLPKFSGAPSSKPASVPTMSPVPVPAPAPSTDSGGSCLLCLNQSLLVIAVSAFFLLSFF